MNKTLFGLKTNKNFKIRYNVESKEVTLIGVAVVGEVEVSELLAFNIPQFISISGVPFYPAKYEFVSGDVYYHNSHPPKDAVKLINNLDIFGEAVKKINVRLKPQDLIAYDKPSRLRSRTPSQNSVMGTSAREYIKLLADNGKINIPQGTEYKWHWCHLAAFTMLPNHRAQHQRNIVCGTSAFNGHMANIEYAVKQLIYKTGKALSLEIQVSILAGTHIANRMRYQVYDTRMQFLHREYFDALTTSFSDHVDYEIIFNKMMNSYNDCKRK